MEMKTILHKYIDSHLYITPREIEVSYNTIRDFCWVTADKNEVVFSSKEIAYLTAYLPYVLSVMPDYVVSQVKEDPEFVAAVETSYKILGELLEKLKSKMLDENGYKDED